MPSRDEVEAVIRECFDEGIFVCHPDDYDKPLMQRRIIAVDAERDARRLTQAEFDALFGDLPTDGEG